MRLQLHGIDDGADVGGLVERVADAQAPPSARFSFAVRASATRFLHQNARARAADLALVEPDRIDHALDRGIEIGVVEDDEGRLAAQFERQGLARAGGGAADRAADLGRAGEGDLVDLRGHQRRAGPAVAGDDVDHARGQPGLDADLGKGQRGERRVFGRFQHHGVARGERRGDLPGQHQQREVPRDDLPADAERAEAGKFLVQQLGPAGVVVEMPRHKRHVDVAALADRLAVVERLQHGKQAGALLHMAGQRIEVARALVARQRSPGGLGGAGGSNGGGDIIGTALTDQGQELPGGGLRVSNRSCRRGEPAADEMAEPVGVPASEPGRHRRLRGGAVFHVGEHLSIVGIGTFLRPCAWRCAARSGR
jgi:hypothetical protein